MDLPKDTRKDKIQNNRNCLGKGDIQIFPDQWSVQCSHEAIVMLQYSSHKIYNLYQVEKDKQTLKSTEPLLPQI